MNLRIPLVIFSGILFASPAITNENESLALLLDKLNALKAELQNLTATLETNSLNLSRLEKSNQIRYVDLDKRIHLLETKLLLQSDEKDSEKEEVIEGINPLAGLVDETIDTGEFELWSNSMKLLDNSRYSEAAENFRLLILSYPEGNYSGDSYFWLGEIYLVQEMYEDSYEIFLSFLSKFDNHSRLPDANYKIALALIGLEQLDEAEFYFNQTISNYPESGAAVLANQDLIKFREQ